MNSSLKNLFPFPMNLGKEDETKEVLSATEHLCISVLDNFVN